MGALRLRAPAVRLNPGWNVVGLAGTPAMALPRLNGVRAGGSSAGGWEYVEVPDPDAPRRVCTASTCSGSVSYAWGVLRDNYYMRIVAGLRDSRLIS